MTTLWGEVTADGKPLFDFDIRPLGDGVWEYESMVWNDQRGGFDQHEGTIKQEPGEGMHLLVAKVLTALAETEKIREVTKT